MPVERLPVVDLLPFGIVRRVAGVLAREPSVQKAEQEEAHEGPLGTLEQSVETEERHPVDEYEEGIHGHDQPDTASFATTSASDTSSARFIQSQ